MIVGFVVNHLAEDTGILYMKVTNYLSCLIIYIK